MQTDSPISDCKKSRLNELTSLLDSLNTLTNKTKIPADTLNALLLNCINSWLTSHVDFQPTDLQFCFFPYMFNQFKRKSILTDQFISLIGVIRIIHFGWTMDDIKMSHGHSWSWTLEWQITRQSCLMWHLYALKA